MKVRFDENDDLVIEDISDDVMAGIEKSAQRNERSIEDELRYAIELEYGAGTGSGACQPGS